MTSKVPNQLRDRETESITPGGTVQHRNLNAYPYEFLQIGGNSGDCTVNGEPLSVYAWVSVATSENTRFEDTTGGSLTILYRQELR